MNGPWWEDEDSDDLEVRPPTVFVHAGDTSEPLWDDRYPHIPRRPDVGTPPPELSARKQRRWVRNERRRVRTEDQQQRNAAVTGWRRGRPESARMGLGVVLVVIAVVFAALIGWRASTGHSDAPTASHAAGVDSSPAAPSSTAAPSMTSGPARETHQGGDVVPPPAAPAELAGKEGDTAYQFLLAYDSYNPANPAAVDTWTSTWRPWATDELTSSAKSEAPVLWQQAASDRVSIIAQAVAGCRQTQTAPTDTTWECDVVRARFPIGGDSSSSYNTETAHLRVEVTGGEEHPLVSTVAVLGVDAPTAATPTS